MVVIRSTLFMIGLVLWTVLAGIVCLPALLMPRGVIWAVSSLWARVVLWMLRVTVGLRYGTRGEIRPDAKAQYIYAMKHQSAWETIAFQLIGPPFAGVLKAELKQIPIYGWYLMRAGMVPIQRSARGSALKEMLRIAKAMVESGRHLLIMPEGTRVAPGRRGRYHPGVYALYKYLQLPVMPVAHNAGLFWGRNSFVKKAGTVTMEFLEPIPPGLEKAAFMETLENRIETAAQRLFEQGQAELQQ